MPRIHATGKAAFSECYSLWKVKLSNNIEVINQGTLAVSNITSLVIPEGVTAIYPRAFSACSNLDSIVIPKSVTFISVEVFLDCDDLKTINFTGTKAEWNAIEKSESWDRRTPSYTIHCTDGDITK